MKNYFKSFALFSIVFLIFSFPHINGQGIETITKTNLRAGVAKVDITPPIGIPLGGYDVREGPATGIHDPLYAVVIVFDDGETRAAIVSLDILQVLQQAGDSIRSAIQSATGIHKDHIIINASHTHGSPWIDTDIHYQNEIIAKTAGAARIAVSRLRPVSMGYGEGEIDFNISRRTIDADGKCHPKLNPDGICDHRVKVLRLDDSDSMTPMSVIMHVVCHSNVFRGENTEVSGDFPGVAKSFIEQAYDHSTTAMFLQGCAGDIRPNLPDIDTEGDGYGRSGSEADLTWCGWTLGTEVVRVATKLRVHEQLIQRQSQFKITAAMAILELDADAEKLNLATLQRDRIIGGKSLLPIQVIKIGDIWFVGLPGEPVVEYGLQIEMNMEGLGKVFVMGFSAGDAGYIPVEHMFKEGGYEAECPYTPSCEKAILDGVNQLVKEVLEKSKFVNCHHTISPSCDTWVALGNSTKDGSVIMGKNSDRPSVEAQPLEYFPRIYHKKGELVKCTHIEIPQAEVTYAHMGSKIWWTFGYEHGTNEWGVTIGNEAMHVITELVEKSRANLVLKKLKDHNEGTISTPCVNVFRPFYFAGQTIPDQYGAGTNIYSEDSPWWRAEKVKRLCDLNYNRLAPVVKGVFSETEKWELDRSETIENEVLRLLEEGKNEEAEKILRDNCETNGLTLPGL